MNHHLPFIERDAVDMLRREHLILKHLFHTFAHLKHPSVGREADVVGQICLGLTLHERAEEEVFLPAILAATKLAPVILRVTSGHVEVHALIARLDELEPGDAGHDCAVAELAACVSRHMDDEESLLFTCLDGMDTTSIGRAMVLRQREWRADVVPRDSHHALGRAWPATCHVIDDWEPLDPPDAGAEVPVPR